MNLPVTEERRRLERTEDLLAGLLRYGAIFASVWMAVGMALDLGGYGPLEQLAERCMRLGIIVLIMLPVLRVALTTGVFLYERDYLFATVSGMVLLIIALGFVLGTGGIH